MENNNAFIKAFPITWVLTAVVTIPLWIVAGQGWGAPFLLGSVTTLLMMSVMYKSTYKVLQEGTKNPQQKVIFNYVLRYLFYAIILIVAGLADGLEVIGVAIGLFTFKLSIYIALFLERRGEKS